MRSRATTVEDIETLVSIAEKNHQSESALEVLKCRYMDWTEFNHYRMFLRDVIRLLNNPTMGPPVYYPVTIEDDNGNIIGGYGLEHNRNYSIKYDYDSFWNETYVTLSDLSIPESLWKSEVTDFILLNIENDFEVFSEKTGIEINHLAFYKRFLFDSVFGSVPGFHGQTTYNYYHYNETSERDNNLTRIVLPSTFENFTDKPLTGLWSKTRTQEDVDKRYAYTNHEVEKTKRRFIKKFKEDKIYREMLSYDYPENFSVYDIFSDLVFSVKFDNIYPLTKREKRKFDSLDKKDDKEFTKKNPWYGNLRLETKE